MRLLVQVLLICLLLAFCWLGFDYYWNNYQLSKAAYFWLRWPWYVGLSAATLPVLFLADKYKIPN